MTTPDERLAQPVDIRETLRPVLSRWWLIVIVVAATTFGSYEYYKDQPLTYQSSTLLFVSNTESAAVLLGEPQNLSNDRQLTNLATLVVSAPVARMVAARIGYAGDPRDLLAPVSAAAAKGSDFITVSAVGDSPASTALLANAFAGAFVDSQTEQLKKSASRALNIARGQRRALPRGPVGAVNRAELTERIRELDALVKSAEDVGIARQINRAVAGTSSDTSARRKALFGFVIGLALAIAAVFFLERLDRRIKRLADLELHYGQPVLTEVPRSRTPAPLKDGINDLPRPFREPFRRLRTALELATIDAPIRTLLVTSAVPREGKSTVARSLAIAYHEAGLRVALVDTDLRKPSLDGMMGLEREPGLTEVLTGSIELGDALQRVNVQGRGIESLVEARATTSESGQAVREREAPGLRALTSGSRPPNPPELLATDAMQALLAHLALDHDLVIVDSAPLLAVSDALPLLNAVDGAVVVARLGTTKDQDVERVMDEFDRVPGVRLLGLVANDVKRASLPGRGYRSEYEG